MSVLSAGVWRDLSTAYQLIGQGLKVVLLEAETLASGQTGRTTAHLSFIQDERIYKLIEKMGVEKTALLLQSHLEAIDTIEKNVQEEKINCDFRRVDGYLFLGRGDAENVLKKNTTPQKK